MKTKYNSLNYWENLIISNKTKKNKLFLEEAITMDTKFLHYVIFNKKTGIESDWIAVPDMKALLGFIEYIFLPEAYYKWVEGKEKAIINIPTRSIDDIFKLSVRSNKITKTEEKCMKEEINKIKRLWNLPDEKIYKELRIFCGRFNNDWLGDSTQFLYLKIFKNANELADFVFNTNIKTNFEQEFEEKIGMNKESWFKLCEQASINKNDGEKLKFILSKHLSEVI
ncbi:hypothetical protein [Clostridium tarantellae]|uniref:Uncharacterized protein n=1 Tax=Clostridium tarantellae TaxID=39493 RepID=A0A6I1MQY3_9CLOT|nr:hypothetical protein [Clostridium tarantellae]MPQ44632.1 hypothetical protein [Clostridium tarantellae]